MHKFPKLFLLSVLTGVLLLASGARSLNPIYAAGETCAFPYVVSNGDWLSRIAARLLGDMMAYPQIADATNAQSGADGFAKITDPNRINENDKLCIPQAAHAPQGLELSALANASYTTNLVENGTVTLTDGVYKKPVGDGSAGFEMLVLEEVAYGKLDGVDTAAVVTWDSGGGTARFYNLRLMQVQDGALKEIAALEIGDRIFINTLKIENNQIIADMVQQAASSADCCPTEQVVNTYAFQDGALKRVSTEKTASQ